MFFQNIYSKSFLINLIILFIPITNMAGNLLLNLNVVLLLIFALLFYRLNIFKIEYNLIDKLIIIFFIYIFLNGILNNFLNFNFPNAPRQDIVIIKSILFLRYLLLYFVIRFLVINKIINFKIFFYIFGLSALFVSIDLIIQFTTGKNIFGFEGEGRRLGGVFGTEYIAGGYIQRFFIFLPFSILIFSKMKQDWKIQLIFFAIIIISLLGILFSGNRIPLIMSILILGFMFIYENKIRKLLIALLIVFITSFSFLFKINKDFSLHYQDFKNRSVTVLNYLKDRVTTTGNVQKITNPYVKEWESGVLTWQQNKIFGGGIKSFYFHCSTIDEKIMVKFIGSCNSHPHNYYLEIAASLGLFGFVILTTIFFLVLYRSIKILHFPSNFFDQKNILIPFYIVFIVEIIPLKTTGSIFTTVTANFLFIILPIIVGLIDLKKSNNYYEKK